MKKQKSLPALKKELQIIFNTFIRLRDKDQPCISCGQFKVLQCGHFFNVGGHDGLRFNEDNANGECAGCNCFDLSHLINYGDNLIERIGIERFQNLKNQAKIYKREGHKWTRYELLEMIEKYKAKIRELQ